MEGKPCWKSWLEEMEGDVGRMVDTPLPRIADNVIRKADIGTGHRVLDLGAGMGLLTSRVARTVGPSGAVVAIDNDQGCIDHLASDPEINREGNVKTVLGMIEDLPFEDGEFDAVLSRSALVYTNDMPKAAKEIVRVLKQGGRFSLYEPIFSEARYRGHPEEAGEEFLAIDLALRNSGGCRIDRERIRDAFRETGNSFDSMIDFTELSMEKRDQDEIITEYLYDMPGDLAAFNVLRGQFDESLIIESVKAYAKAASAGWFSHIVAGIYLWGFRD